MFMTPVAHIYIYIYMYAYVAHATVEGISGPSTEGLFYVVKLVNLLP